MPLVERQPRDRAACFPFPDRLRAQDDRFPLPLDQVSAVFGIVEMIGVPSCNNVVYCRLLALGSLPCGGPSEYLAYAGTRTGNTGLLETKAAELGFLEEELRKERKDAGACAVLPVPTLACINGRCALVSPAR